MTAVAGAPANQRRRREPLLILHHIPLANPPSPPLLLPKKTQMSLPTYSAAPPSLSTTCLSSLDSKSPLLHSADAPPAYATSPAPPTPSSKPLWGAGATTTTPSVWGAAKESTSKVWGAAEEARSTPELWEGAGKKEEVKSVWGSGKGAGKVDVWA